MSDSTKRKIIRFLNRFDRLQAKGNRNRGWNPTTVMYDEKSQKEELNDELEDISGSELSRELGRQILYTLPTALLLLAVLITAMWVIASK